MSEVVERWPGHAKNCRFPDDECGCVLPLFEHRALIAQAEKRGAVEALREAANRWTQGEWSNVMLPKPTPPAVPVIAYANRMGDWLRDRADRLDAQDGGEGRG